MSNKSTFWIDLALTVFSATVALIYFGGYYFPQPVGSWTGLGMLVYLLMLIFAALNVAFRYLGKSKTSGSSPPESKRGAKRS